MKIVFASTNKGKIREVARLLAPHEILSLDDIDFHEDIVEDGNSFIENAFIKARRVFNAKGYPTIADDSGICVNALNGEPGIYSARYAGTGNDSDNNALLLERLRPYSDHSAKYVCALAAVLPNGQEASFIGELEGEIIFEYRGTGGFGYDPIFYLKEYGLTTAELSMEEKNKISHRGKAIMQFKDYLDKME